VHGFAPALMSLIALAGEVSKQVTGRFADGVWLAAVRVLPVFALACVI
jgi:hypothetical protein